MQLISTSLAGNIHTAAATINAMGLAEFCMHLDFSGSATIAVFKVPDHLGPRLRAYFNQMPEHWENPAPQRTWV